MSWFISAVNRAVEAGGQNSVSRAVRGYAETIVNQTLVGGSRMFHDGPRNIQSYKLAAKTLEEVSVSCTGEERVQLLRRWLVALKQIEKLHEDLDTDHLATVAIYYDPDLGGDPMDFRDVFLRSQALEGMTLSLILNEPNEEELSLLQEIFRICLMGGKETLDVTLSSVQDLAKAFSAYKEEVLAKRTELLQLVQDVMGGLKVDAEIVRIDSEVSNIHKRLDDMKNQPVNECEISSEKPNEMSMEYLNEALAHIKICSRLVELLWRKKIIMQNYDSLALHKQKVDRLKVLSESLASSASQAEKRIFDNRMQEQEALKFHVTKSDELSQAEEELTAGIKNLQKREEELEEELKQVKAALVSAQIRLHNAKEERNQLEEASNQIISHFTVKDDELSKSIASHRAEAKVCNTFINFLESTRLFQSLCVVKKEKLLNEELDRHGEYFVNWATTILEELRDKLRPSLCSLRELVEKLRRYNELTNEERNDAFLLMKNLEKHYQILQSKMKTSFSLIESIKTQFSDEENPEFSRKSDEKIEELLRKLEKMRHDFEAIDIPALAPETPPRVRIPRLPFLSRQSSRVECTPESGSVNVSRRRMSLPFNAINAFPLVRSISNKSSPVTSERERESEREVEHLESFGAVSRRKSSYAEEQLSKLKFELELELESQIVDSPTEAVIEWEFDEKFDKEPRKSI